jgi:hypothetical protein
VSAWSPGIAVALVGATTIGELQRLTRGTVSRVTKTFVEVVDDAGARSRWTLHGWPWGQKAKPRGPRLRPWRTPEDDDHCRRADAVEALDTSAYKLRQTMHDRAARALPIERLELAAELLAQAVEALS